jgi:hypothetical protein
MRQLSFLYKTVLAVPKSHPIHLQLKRPTHSDATHHLNTIQLEHSPPLEKDPSLKHTTHYFNVLTLPQDDDTAYH